MNVLTSAFWFIVIFGVLVATHEGGHYFVARKCGIHVREFWLGIGPNIFKKQMKNGTLFKLKLVPLGGACVFDDTEEAAKKKHDPSYGEAFYNAALWKRMLTILAGPTLNFVTAAIFALTITLIAGIDKPIIRNVIEGTPAAEAGIEAGDTVLAIDGKPVKIYRDFTFERLFDDKKPVTIKGKHKNGEIYEVTITPEFDEESGRNLIGVSGGTNSSVAISEVIPYTGAEMNYWFNYMGTFFKMIGNHSIGIESMSGPIGIAGFIGNEVQRAAEVSKIQILVTVFRLIVFLSINLGIINLIPFPGLDGGQFLLLCIEGLRKGKRMKEEHVNQFNMFGIALLLILSGYICIQDVAHIVFGF